MAENDDSSNKENKNNQNGNGKRKTRKIRTAADVLSSTAKVFGALGRSTVKRARQLKRLKDYPFDPVMRRGLAKQAEEAEQEQHSAALKSKRTITDEARSGRSGRLTSSQPTFRGRKMASLSRHNEELLLLIEAWEQKLGIQLSDEHRQQVVLQLQQNKQLMMQLDHMPNPQALPSDQQRTALDMANTALLGVLTIYITGAIKPTQQLVIEGNRLQAVDQNPYNGYDLGPQVIDFQNSLNKPYGDALGLNMNEIASMIAQPGSYPGLNKWLINNGWLDVEPKPAPSTAPTPRPLPPGVSAH